MSEPDEFDALRVQWQAIDSRDRRINVLLRVIEGKDKELAALRAENERLTIMLATEEGRTVNLYTYRNRIAELEKQLADLRAECAQLRLHLESGFMPGTYAPLKNLQDAERERGELKAQLGEAEKRGMERAKLAITKIGGRFEWDGYCETACNAIDAEMEKKP